MLSPVRPTFRLSIISACIAMSSCQAEPTVNKMPQASVIAYPTADAGLGEKLYPDESI